MTALTLWYTQRMATALLIVSIVVLNQAISKLFSKHFLVVYHITMVYMVVYDYVVKQVLLTFQ